MDDSRGVRSHFRIRRTNRTGIYDIKIDYSSLRTFWDGAVPSDRCSGATGSRYRSGNVNAQLKSG